MRKTSIRIFMIVMRGGGLQFQSGVWCIMLLLDRSATKPAGRGSILPLIGLIWAAIWQAHWQCIMEERLWFHESCLARIRIQQLNLSMSINSTAEIEDDNLMPMATRYEEGSNKPSIHDLHIVEML